MMKKFNIFRIVEIIGDLYCSLSRRFGSNLEIIYNNSNLRKYLPERMSLVNLSNPTA